MLFGIFIGFIIGSVTACIVMASDMLKFFASTSSQEDKIGRMATITLPMPDGIIGTHYVDLIVKVVERNHNFFKVKIVNIVGAIGIEGLIMKRSHDNSWFTANVLKF